VNNKVRGFSLLEIIIAMAVMAIMVAIAFPNLTKNSDQLAKQEILRLVAAIEYVRDQSVILNQEYGLNISEEGYQFLVLNEEDEKKAAEWELIKDNNSLGKYEFPTGLDINLSIDGDNLFSSAEESIEIFEDEIDIFENEDKKEKVPPPQIYFLSSGEQNQFSIGISVAEEIDPNDERHFFRVRGFLTGDIKYEGPLVGNLFQDLDREYEDDF